MPAYEPVGWMGVMGKIFYFVTGFGHAAVMVFFVMSGFLVDLFLLILALTYLWCYLVSLVTERQTPRIREWLYRHVGKGVSSKTK